MRKKAVPVRNPAAARQARKARGAALAALGFSGRPQTATSSTPYGPRGQSVRRGAARPLAVQKCPGYIGARKGRYQNVYDRLLQVKKPNVHTSILNKIISVSERITHYDYSDPRVRAVMKNSIPQIQKYLKAQKWAPHYTRRHEIYNAFNDALNMLNDMTDNFGEEDLWDYPGTGDVADNMARWSSCAIDIVCHSVRVKTAVHKIGTERQRLREAQSQINAGRRDAAAKVIQGHFLQAKYAPNGPLFQRWAQESAAKFGMRA